MRGITVVQNLSDAWFRAVKDGKIVSKFDTPDGRRIEFGLMLRKGNPEYYAKDIETGCEEQATVEEKLVGEKFIVQFNGYRALRPGGRILNAGKQQDVSPEAAHCRFYCQDPKPSLSILKRDPLIQFALPHWKWNAYYNAVPFEKEGHFLFIPVSTDGIATVIPHFPQELSCDFLEDILELFRNSGRLILFFNSLHAGASVNHIHLHAVFNKSGLSIESAPKSKRKNGLTVLSRYPASCMVFNRNEKLSEIWRHLDRIQEERKPFNLIFVGERICLIPRNPDHEVVEEFPAGVIGSMELAGKIITVDRTVYEKLDYATIQTAFRKTTVLTR